MGRQDSESESETMIVAAPLRAHRPARVRADSDTYIAFNHNAQADQLPTESRETSISDSLTCSQGAAVAFVKNSCSEVRQVGVRRLTPRECERLQGFPDDYTLIPWRGGYAPDGPRYKALGNSMAVPCMRWIGVRINWALA